MKNRLILSYRLGGAMRDTFLAFEGRGRPAIYSGLGEAARFKDFPPEESNSLSCHPPGHPKTDPDLVDPLPERTREDYSFSVF